MKNVPTFILSIGAILSYLLVILMIGVVASVLSKEPASISTHVLAISSLAGGVNAFTGTILSIVVAQRVAQREKIL
ncbi:MAG: hypothetical protein WC022_00395 [Parcubacteria group bacterium]